MAALTGAGFEDVQVTHRFDCFGGTSKEKVVRRYRVEGVNVSAVKRR